MIGILDFLSDIFSWIFSTGFSVFGFISSCIYSCIPPKGVLAITLVAISCTASGFYFGQQNSSQSSISSSSSFEEYISINESIYVSLALLCAFSIIAFCLYHLNTCKYSN